MGYSNFTMQKFEGRRCVCVTSDHENLVHASNVRQLSIIRLDLGAQVTCVILLGAFGTMRRSAAYMSNRRVLEGAQSHRTRTCILARCIYWVRVYHFLISE